MAQQELDAIAARRAQAYPDSNTDRGVSVVPHQDVVIGPVRTPLFVLLAAGAFVLLIGCGNVGNLVLARGIARQRELAVRGALGAGAGRLARQLLTESIVLALVAAILGAGLAFMGSELLVASLSQHSCTASRRQTFQRFYWWRSVRRRRVAVDVSPSPPRSEDRSDRRLSLRVSVVRRDLTRSFRLKAEATGTAS